MAKQQQQKGLRKIISLYDLRQKVVTDERYARLAIVAARNLGGPTTATLDEAFAWLRTNAQETSEAGVVGEINACRDLVN